LGGTKEAFPPPPTAKLLRRTKASIVSIICRDTKFYRRYFENKYVKKTLSIPMWLNERAEHANISFSGVLHEALEKLMFAYTRIIGGCRTLTELFIWMERHPGRQAFETTR